MKVLVNGEEKEFKEPVSIIAMLRQFGLKPEITVVEINGKIADKSEFDNIKINDGDKVELIRFVGGG